MRSGSDPFHMMPLSEAEVRAAVGDFSTPKLDELRAAVPAMLTTELIGFLISSETLLDRLGIVVDEAQLREGEDLLTEPQQLSLVAGLIAIGDELNKRIPARVP